MARTIHSGSQKSRKAQSSKKTGVQKIGKRVCNKRKSEVERKRARGDGNIRLTQRHSYTLRARPHSYNLRLGTVNSQGAGDRGTPTTLVGRKRKRNCNCNKSGRTVKRRKAQSHISVVTISSTNDDSNMDRTANWLENLDKEPGDYPTPSLKDHQQDRETQDPQPNLVDKNEVYQDNTLNDDLHTSLPRKSAEGLSSTSDEETIAAEAKLLGNVLKRKLAECSFKNINEQEVPEDFCGRLEMGSTTCVLEAVNGGQIDEESKYKDNTFKMDVTIRIYPLETLSNDQIGDESEDLYKPLDRESSVHSSEALSKAQVDKDAKSPIEREAVFRSTKALSDGQFDEDSEALRDTFENQSLVPSLETQKHVQVDENTGVSLEREAPVSPVKTFNEQIYEYTKELIDLLPIEYDAFHPWDMLNDDKTDESSDLCVQLKVHETTVHPIETLSNYQIDNNTEHFYEPVERESTETMSDTQIGKDTDEMYHPTKRESAVHHLEILSSDQIDETNNPYDNLDRESVVLPLETLLDDKIVENEFPVCLEQTVRGNRIEEGTEELQIPLGRESSVFNPIERESKLIPFKTMSCSQIVKDTMDLHALSESEVCSLESLNSDNIEDLCEPLEKKRKMCPLQAISQDQPVKETDQLNETAARELVSCPFDALAQEKNRFFFGPQSTLNYQDLSCFSDGNPVVTPFKTFIKEKINDDTKDFHEPKEKRPYNRPLGNSSQNQSSEEIEQLYSPRKRKLDSNMFDSFPHTGTNKDFYEPVDKRPCIEIEPRNSPEKRELISSTLVTEPHTNNDLCFRSQPMNEDSTVVCTNIFQNPNPNSTSTQSQSDKDYNETNDEQSDNNFFFGPQSNSNDCSFICTNHFQNPPKVENNSNTDSTQAWFDQDTDEDEETNKCKEEN